MRICDIAVVVLVAVTLMFPQVASAEEAADNGKCHVCHPFLKTEKLTTDHLAVDITCDGCHGDSIEHMHDEMLMTAPDQLYGREEVRSFCSKCHEPDSDNEYYAASDHESPAKVKAYREKWHGRMRPNGRAVTEDSICTDCHGTHNLDKRVGSGAEQEDLTKWTAVFNGKDLAGWKATGSANWAIRNGRIVATLGADAKSGDLWTTTPYEDYQLAVTFKAEWPIKAGIWTRGKIPVDVDKKKTPPGAESAGSAYGARVEIFDSVHPKAHTGSIYLPDMGLAVLNFREGLLDKESWNTIAVKTEGNRTGVWLNGEEIGAIASDGPGSGSIGFHIERDADGKASELTIREVLVQPIERRIQ